MANKVYDSESDKRNAPLSDTSLSDNQTSPGSASYNRDSLGRNGSRDAQNKSLYNPSDSKPGNNTDARGASSQTIRSNKSDSRGSLRNAEESSTGAGSNDSIYNAAGDSQSGLRGRAKNKLNNFKSRIQKNKLLVGGIAGSSAVIVALIILLLIFLGAFKIVAFAEHVAAYQFARTTAQMAEDAGVIDSEKLGIDSLLTKYSGTRGVQLYNILKNKYAGVSGGASDLWSKFDNYRPDKVMQNFANDNKFKLNTSTTKFGKTYVSSVSGSAIGGTAELQNRSLGTAFRNHVIPGYKFATRDIPISRSIAPGLIKELKASDIGPITRARIASAIRSELDVSLTAWTIGKYTGKSQEEAAAQAEKDALAIAEGSGNPINPNVPDKVNSAATDAENATNKAAQDPVKLKQLVDSNGQLSQDFIDSINSSFPSSAFASFESAISHLLALANPVYKYAVPLCLIYDGSLKNSGPTIDNQTAQLERSALWVQSAAAQEKDGSKVNAEAVGATNWKLGNISTSNAEARSGGQIVNTSNYQSAEASPIGQYSIADYGLGSTVGGVVDSLAPHICPAATNLWVGITLGGLAIFLSGGTSTAGDGLVDAATQSLGDKIVARIVGSFAAGRDAVSKVFSWDTVKSLGVIGVGTVVAKSLVMSQTGAVHNSLATGQSYDNDVDNGTNIYANQVEQRQFYGAPLSDYNLRQENASAQAQLASLNSKQSTYNRYFALSNANSLLSHLVIDASSFMNGSFFTSLLHVGGTLLDPIRTLGSLLSPILSQSSYAATPVTSVNTFYGNVQFGFTSYEHSLITGNASYAPLENQLYLDQSKQEGNIAARYNVCFDGSESIGTMLANGDIQRTSSGDVIPNKGLCSPSNLGTNNHDDGCNITHSSHRGCDYTGCPSNSCGSHGKGFHDLVFRWRVAQSYKNTLDQLTGEQTITSSGSTTPLSSSSWADNKTWVVQQPQLNDYIRHNSTAANALFNNTRTYVVLGGVIGKLDQPPSARTTMPAGWTAPSGALLFTAYDDSYSSDGKCTPLSTSNSTTLVGALKHGLGSDIKAVIYDPEDNHSHTWPTPACERNTPTELDQAAQNFANAAHSAGLVFIDAPLPLTNYVNAGAKYADILDLQVQPSENDPSTYATNLDTYVAATKALNPNIKLIAETTSNASTATSPDTVAKDMVSNQASVDGYWPFFFTPNPQPDTVGFQILDSLYTNTQATSATP